MPGSRHYSWDKGANILGLGRRSLVKVPVDRFCRMDVEKLEEMLQEALDKRVPVVGVTAVFGTTQEGAVDELDKILQLREKFAKQGEACLIFAFLKLMPSNFVCYNRPHILHPY